MIKFEDLVKELKPIIKKFRIEELNDDIGIKVMSGGDREIFEDTVMKMTGKDGNMSSIKGMRSTLLKLSLVNEDGSLMFNDSNLDQLNGLPAPIINALFNEAMKINGLVEEQLEIEKKS